MSVAVAAVASTAANASCRHCGDGCDGSVSDPDRNVFCCRGCAAVHALLQARGLDTFYTCDASAGASQRAADGRDPDRFAVLDDPAVAARLVTFDDGVVASVTFAVPDLHCGACLWLLERLWRVDDAIVRSEADLVRRTVHVWFRPDRLSVRGVAERLAAIGYEPIVAAETPVGVVAPQARRLRLQLGMAGFAFGNIMLFSVPRYLQGAPLEGGFQRLFDVLNLALATPVLLFSAADYFAAAWRAIRARHIALDVPVALGLAVLFGRSAIEIVTSRSEGFLDSFTGLVFFLLIGRMLQQKAFDRIAFNRTYRSFLPLSVRVERKGGAEPTPIERLAVGDRVLVRPQEVIPADAVVLDDGGVVDYAFVTGESRPIDVAAGDLVRAGGRASTTLRLELVREVAHSELARLWSDPALGRVKRHWLEDVSNRFGAVFALMATGLALAGAAAWWPDIDSAAQVATAVLIIACPCALTLAAPLTLGTAVEMLGRRGLYLRNTAVVLDLARVDTLALDKTGTLTSAARGTTATPCGLSELEWRLVRRLAAESVHPVSRAIAAAASAHGDVQACREVPGQGLRGSVDGHDVVVGTASFIAKACGAFAGGSTRRTSVAIDGRLRGWVQLQTPPRDGIEATVAALAGTHQIQLLSGDDATDAPRWRPLFGDRMSFRQSPHDKLVAVRTSQADGRRVLMIGDGLNDAGALAAADVGIAVSDETACVVPACDAVIGGDALTRLPSFLRYVRHARRLVLVCFAVSVAYNVGGVSLALTGALTPLVTAMLMPVSSLTIIGLSLGGMHWLARELDA
ncbi:MAG: heavy metal translocating P-type ATPase metal-binding domain-containing protein [Vicinamibacteraceae bacterium]